MKKSSMTGKEIKQMRKGYGLKQRECALMLGIGTRMWQKYEEGYPCKQLYIDVIQDRMANYR